MARNVSSRILIAYEAFERFAAIIRLHEMAERGASQWKSQLDQKVLTEEHTRDIEGVKDEKYDLKVSSELPALTSGEVIDGASTCANKTKVTTRDGVVTVSGDAKNQAEMDLVTKFVNDFEVVKSVVNNMGLKRKSRFLTRGTGGGATQFQRTVPIKTNGK